MNDSEAADQSQSAGDEAWQRNTKHWENHNDFCHLIPTFANPDDTNTHESNLWCLGILRSRLLSMYRLLFVRDFWFAHFVWRMFFCGVVEHSFQFPLLWWCWNIPFDPCFSHSIFLSSCKNCCWLTKTYRGYTNRISQLLMTNVFRIWVEAHQKHPTPGWIRVQTTKCLFRKAVWSLIKTAHLHVFLLRLTQQQSLFFRWFLCASSRFVKMQNF